MKSISLSLILLLALGLGCAQKPVETPAAENAAVAATTSAQPNAPHWKDRPKPEFKYLTEKSWNVGHEIKAPPKKGSRAEKKDFKKMLALQKSRTAGDCVAANDSVKYSYENLFGRGENKALTDAELNAAKPIAEQLFQEVTWFLMTEKIHWDRPRPYDANPELSPCIPKESSLAYPSGHATISRLMAEVLGDIYPSKKKALMAKADSVAASRVLGGVHHPTDIEAGKRMADNLFRKLKKSKAFKADVKEARKNSKAGV